MGWQGRLREAKAHRLFAQAERSGYRLVSAWKWRSNQHVWFTVRHRERGELETFRLNLQTGACEHVQRD